MRHRAIPIVLLAFLASVPETRAQTPPQNAATTIDEYASRLEAIARAVDALDERQPLEGRRLVGTIPAAFVVNAAGQTFTIPVQWIAQDLMDWQRQPSLANRTRLAGRIRAARADAHAFMTPPADRVAARTAATQILSGREFRGVRRQSWWNSLMQRVLRWLLGWLELVVGSSSLPAVTNLFVYALIGAAVIALGLWARRALRSSARVDEAAAAPLLETLPKRPWQDWLVEAQRMAAQQDWREAIRSAYWCGIVFLESKEVWTTDGSRTPREYVRLLPAGDAHAPALRSLTAVLERVWYAAAPADAARYAETIALLRSLGCPA
jgi:hypothetical protein